MKAVVLQALEQLTITEVSIPELKTGEVLIRMKTAALNHRDQWCRVGKYPGMRFPSILGSDGCGIVEQVANSEDAHWQGKEVIINPNVGWGDNPEFQSLNFTILGMPTNGTLAEYLVVPTHRLHQKPPQLTDEQAAALPLGGLTAFRALFNKANLKKGNNILITGIGGGVSQIAMQFAIAAGAKVYFTSGNQEKIEKALASGATFGVNYKSENWDKELLKRCYMGFDVILDGTGGEAFGTLAKMIAPAGTMVVYGTTAGMPSSINLPRLFFSQASIKGTTMGNDQEFVQMLDFVNANQVVPMVSSVRPLAEAVSAFDEMNEGRQFGKLVIRISE